jgi:hypothetical protein
MCIPCMQGIDNEAKQAEGVANVELPPNQPEAMQQPASLLEELRDLPEAFPMQPVLWIPRRCKQAAAEILRRRENCCHSRG